jgi:hypothetical protein
VPLPQPAETKFSISGLAGALDNPRKTIPGRPHTEAEGGKKQ